MLKYLFAATAAFVLAASPQQARSDNSKLTVIVFPGVQNLPLFTAQAKGLYAKRGLDVEIKFTPNSDELRNGLAEGRYQIAHSAVDNAFALKDKANVDIAVVLGGEGTQQRRLRGQANRRDGVASGGNDEGQNNDRGDVESSLFRSRRKGRPEGHGHCSRGTRRLSGNSAFVLRSWAAANADTLVKYLEAYIEGLRWSSDPKNRAEAISLLVERLKLPEDIAALSYDSTKSDFNRDGAIDMDGVRNVLKLRAQFEGGTPATPEKYLDLSYYQKARAGLSKPGDRRASRA